MRKLKDKKVYRGPPIPTSAQPMTEVWRDQNILKIRHLKANIFGNNVFLRFTEKVVLKIGTKHLNFNLQKGTNKNITLILDLKQIYKNGDCLVETEEERTLLETSTTDQFEWDEELVEDFANNPFLSSPMTEIVDLIDSDDEDDKEDSERNVV